jgi:uncharacterized membrane protein YeaQ/YmgE (transglycosylase-associated protein family)
MTPGELIVLLVVAAIIGAVGQALAGYSAGGCLVSIVVGFIGAWLGRWLAAQVGLPDLFVISVGGVSFPLLWSIVGAALFVLLLGLLRRPRV